MTQFKKPVNSLKVFLSLLFFFFSVTLMAQETMTNESIISLTTAKVAKPLIISKVKSTKNNYDLSSRGIVSLKEGKVADQVVEEMLLSSTNLPVVTNEDVIIMNNGHVSRDIILKKIQYSPTNFNTSTEGLISLKNAKIPDPVMKVMLQPKTGNAQK